jgi:hypothetical protein
VTILPTLGLPRTIAPLRLAQLASAHMRTVSPPTRSVNLLEYKHVLRCGCCRSPIRPPNSADLARCCRQLAPRRAGI